MSYIIGILLLLGACVSANRNVELSLNLDLFVRDDYNNVVQMNYVIFRTIEDDAIVSNYQNIIFFYLYTRDRSHDSVQLYVGDTDSLRRGQFDSMKPTIFVLHGWSNSYQSPSCIYIRDAYLHRGEYNVILVDWSAVSTGSYDWATSQVVPISQYVASMIDFLESQGVDSSNITIIGHSLGAHIAGLSSYYAKNKVNYVVGLDPAGPTFYNKSRDSRMSKDDATYVQTIHTSRIIGDGDQIGDADFYVESVIDPNECEFVDYCSHMRAYEYFAESINSRGFLARRCDNFSDYERGKCDSNDVAYMGGAVPDYNAQGSYYLTVNEKPPFAKNSPPM